VRVLVLLAVVVIAPGWALAGASVPAAVRVEAAETYIGQRPQWAPGLTAAYRGQVEVESRVGEHVSKKQSSFSYRLAATGTTPDDLLTVELTREGREVGSFVLSRDGRVVRAVPAGPADSPMFRAARGLFENPLFEWTVGQELHVARWYDRRLPLADLGGVGPSPLLDRLAGSGQRDVEMVVAVDGFRDEGLQKLAVLRAQIPEALDAPVTIARPGEPELVLESLTVDTIIHVDTATGFVASSRSVSRVAGRLANGRAVSVRIETSETLDESSLTR
jgi:hypothetical protein